MTNLEPVTFYLADDTEHPYDGFDEGTRWNGIPNVSVTPETRDAIVADLASIDLGDDGQAAEDIRSLPIDDDGLVSLGGGFVVSFAAELSNDECEAIGADGRDGRGTITEANLSDVERERLAAYRLGTVR